MPFIIIFIIIPFLEIAVFMSVGEHIGLLTTLFLAFLTAILGGALVRHQGLYTIFEMRKTVEQGGMPLDHFFDGLCLVAAGALLITPGFVTDGLGFALLVPSFRTMLRHVIKTKTSWSVTQNYESSTRPVDPNVLEGDFERMDDQ